MKAEGRVGRLLTELAAEYHTLNAQDLKSRF